MLYRQCYRYMAGAFVSCIACGVSHATQFELMDGAVKGRLDSVLNYGLSWRVGGPDKEINSVTNGGDQNFSAGDIVVNRLTGTHDLELSFGQYYGAFFRGTYYYDQANESDLGVTAPGVGPIVDRSWASKRAISDISARDAFVYGDLRAFDIPVRLRFGEQVISWGESTFIGGSLNDINTTDVSQLRTPGAELKNALLPNMAAHFVWELANSLALEGFYLFDFDQVKIDPAGTFFNTATFVADGGTHLPTPVGALTRRGDHFAKNSGQFGFAVRYFNPTFGQGFEAAGYYMTLHSHNPFLATQVGSRQYFLDYPEDIDIYGLSANSQLGSWAISGEMSYRRNAPISVGGGAALVGAALGAPTLLPKDNGIAFGWDRAELYQTQFSFQKTIIPRWIKADNGGFLAEVGYHRVLDKPALYLLDNSAWGYQVRINADYNRALFNIVNLTPQIAFRHDVRGTAGPFLDEAKSITAGINWNYLIKYTGSVSYTTNFDGDNTRLDRDRNWMSINFSYEF